MSKGKQAAYSKPKSNTDWDYALVLLTTTNMSNRKIAEEVGVSEAAVRQFIKANKVERTMTREVRERVQVQRIEQAARDQGLDPETLTQEELVEIASGVVLKTLDKHDKLLVNLRGHTEDMLAELKKESDRRPGKAKLSLSIRVGVLEKLTSTAHRLIAMEREALNQSATGNAYEEKLAELGGDV